MLAGLLAGCALLGIEKSGLLDPLMQKLAPQQLDWNNDYAVVEHLRARLVADRLVSVPGKCLLFIINGNDPPNAARFRVMEKPTDGCPAAKGTLPQLMTVRVNRPARQAEVDAGTPSQFRPLP
ncbi:hypothetical protein [Rhizosaccharibacter radicis]|uniref:Uncharacterized protein n=1 Tax=Rhizosaccharibacter radicis TaxID=2782605 RepID=A0ABT1VZW8_9PROT|nr:hypothetical protein [Acetobacteraceae bacterium KSS12]